MATATPVLSRNVNRTGWLTETGREYTFADMNELCGFLAREIIASKMTFTKIAEKAGVCISTVSNLAHGETHFPRAGTVFQILRVFGYEVVVRR